MTCTAAMTERLMKGLKRRVQIPQGNSEIEKIVLEHGVPFTGIDRPKGVRLGPMKRCFPNSYYSASEHRDMLYVEGFAMVADQPPFHHAWISPDGVHAIDVTLRNHPASSIGFVGIPFSVSLATKLAADGSLPLLPNAWLSGAKPARVCS